MPTVPTDDNKGMFSAQPEQSESGVPLDYTKKQAPTDTRSPAEDAGAPPARGMFDGEQEAKPTGGGLFDPTEQLKAAVHYGAQTNSDEAARILRLKEATALPEDLVGRNADELERATRVKSFDVPDFVKRSPITAEWLSQSPNHTAATWNDLPKLGKMEDFFTRPAELMAMPEDQLTEMARASAKKRMEKDFAQPLYVGKKYLPHDEQGQKQLEERYFQEELNKLKKEEEFIAGDAPVGVFEQAGRRFAENPAAALPFYSGLTDLANATEVYQAAKAAIAKQATPEQMQLLVRNARIERAAQRRGTTFLADVSAIVGQSAVFAGELAGTGGVYEGGKKLLYKEGARQAAEGVLRKGMQLALEGVGWAVGAGAQTLANPVRIAEGAVSSMTPDVQLTGDAKEPITVNANTELAWSVQVPKAFLRQWAEIGGERTGALLGWLDKPINKLLYESWARKVPGATADLFEKALKAGGIHGIAGEMGEEEFTKLINHATGVEEYRLPTAKELATQAVAFAVPGAAKAGLTHVQAKAQSQGFKNYGTTVKESELFQKAPEVFERVVEFQAEKAGKLSVLMPIESWDEYWTGKGKDPGEVAVEIIGSREGYDEAKENGTDLVIPTSRYAVTIAPSEHNAFFSKELRWKELDRNEREAEEEKKAIEQADTEATKLELGTEGAKLRDELQAAGQAPELAEKNALLIQEFAARQEIPLELARTILPLAIQQGTPTKKDGGLEQEKADHIVPYEAVPAKEYVEAADSATPETKEKITKEVTALLIDSDGKSVIAKELGLPGELGTSRQSGYYGSQVSPNIVTEFQGVPASEIRRFARALQLILRQAAVPYFTPVKDPTDTSQLSYGVAITLGVQLDDTTQQKLGDILRDLGLGPDAGFTKVSANRIVIINFKNKATGQTLYGDDGAFLSVLSKLQEQYGREFQIEEIGEGWFDGEYLTHDWAADRDGEALLAEADPSGRSDVRARLGSYARQYDQISEKHFGPRNPVTLNQGPVGSNSGRGSAGRRSGQEEARGSLQEVPRLKGLPDSSPGPIAKIKRAAQEYVGKVWFPTSYVKADPERGKRIADAYEQMPHAPNDPKVKRAYKALIKETLAQYQIVKDLGIKIEVIKPGMENPYPEGPRQVLEDLRNGHLWLFPTEAGFGSENQAADHPLLAKTKEKIGDHVLLANDVFRIVHDVFGHGKEGNGFGPHGEENAWQSHMPMYSPLAAQAMTTETRGQNSWVNFGKLGETNQANKKDTVYADQKAGLLPDWVMAEGLAENAPLVLDQSALPAKSDLSPLGFYSQVAREVEKMDFKEMPAKDLWNRIKNIQGIKAEELESLGLEHWLNARDMDARLPAAGPVYSVGGKGWDVYTQFHTREQAEKWVEEQPIPKGGPAPWTITEIPDPTNRTGRVSKAEVLDFIRSNGVQVEQVVLGESFNNEAVPRLLPQSRAEGDVPLVDELRWDDGDVQEPTQDYINDEVENMLWQYGMDGPGDHSAFGEKWGEVAHETLLEHLDDKDFVLSYEKDEDGDPAVELVWKSSGETRSWRRSEEIPVGANGVNFGTGEAAKKRLKKLQDAIRYALTEKFEGQAEDAARDRYYDDSDYQEIHFTESETGWELRGRHGDGEWYSPETGKSYSGSIEEAQIKLLDDMLEKGVIETEEMRDARIAEQETGEPVPGVRYNLPIGPKPAADINAPTRPAKYASYMDRSNPGGKNKREFVFTSPQAKDYSGEYGGNDHYRERKQIASVITSDRTGPNGERILMIEESQSDRQAKVRNLRLQIAALAEEWKQSPEDSPDRDSIQEKIDVIEQQIESIKAPYENTEAWLALVMKNMIRVASQENYDAIAWSPAELVTKRWGTDALAWVKKTTQTYDVIDDYTQEIIGSYAYAQDAENNLSDGRTVRPPGTYFYIDTAPSHGETGSGLHGMTLEEGAKARAKRIEKFGKMVTGPKDIEEVAGAMSDNPRFAATLWKRMQTEETGIKAPRKEGYEFEYDNLLPKKVVPAILKKLDKNAKVGVGKIGVPKNLTEDEFRDVWQVKLTDEMKAKAKTEGFSLFQPSQNDSDARGQIKLYNDHAQMILPKWSDASTVPHEFAHYFLQIMGILSEMPDASQKVKDRYAAALKFLGVESKDQLTEEHHEKFARSFESYLLNGEAPTAQLKDLFKQFKEWLKAVYKAAPPEVLTPEAKEFFDSIFAAEAEVEQARAQQMMTPLFKDMKAAGFSDEQALSMQAAIQEAQEASQAELTAKTFQEADKKRSKEYEENRELVRSQIEEEVSHQPVYIALSILQKGTMPDGTELPESLAGLKLDAKALKKEWPGQMKSLPKPYVYAREGGVHPDVAAEMLGFGSGSELITAMVEAEPMNQLVDRLTDEQMKAQFPSLQETGALSVEAMKAIHNDKQDELYRKELEYMLSEHFAKFKQMTRRIAGRPPAPTASIKEQAAEAIAKKQVRETNPLLYQRAEAKAGKEAADLLLKGDFAGAVEAKTRQRYNHALYRAAVEAKENAEKAAEYMRKFDKASVRERMGKAGSDYLEQIEAILERFGFNTVSGKAIDRKNDLRAWVEAQREEGIAVDLPEKLLSEAFRKNYKELTNAELAEVRETVENIEHLARLKNKLLTNEKVREIEEAEAMLLSTIEAHHQLKDEVLPLAPGLKDKILQNKSKFFAAHTRMEFLFEFLDGVKSHGAFWNLMFKPFVEAEAAEAELAKKDTEALARIFSVYTRAERAEWFGKPIFIAEAKTDKFDGNINKAGILAIALNWGNEYNRQALMEGYGWDERQVLKILEQLDEKDVATVNALWAHIDTYWEAARDLQKEMTGVAPQKVQGSPAVIRAGKLNGGYYPIKFDHDRSYRQLQLDEKAALGEQFGHATRAMTRHGHLIERTSTGGKPLLLNLTVLSGHLSQVRHDVTHRRAIIDVGKLVNRPKIRAAIIGAAGSQMYRQLNPWLKGIAGDTSPDLVDGWEPILSLMRTNMTKVNLGLKATSGLVQTLGYFNAAHVLGVKYARRGLRALNPVKLKENWAFITERSAMMKNRLDNYDRDVRDIVQKQNVVQGADDAWFYHIGFMDLALSVPAWMGAYEKAMDGEVENIDKGDEKSAVEYADSTVRKTMAAGAAKDLAQVQRGNELKRLFTAFYSQLSIQFNLLQQAGQHFALTKDFGRLASAATFLWFLPAILDDVIKGRGPDDEDEWLPWVTKKAATYPFQTMVFMRDIVNMMERRFETGRRADYTMSPVVQGIESVANASYSLAKPLMGEELTRGDAKDVTMAAGYMVGLPSRQVWMTSEYLYDYMTGEVQPSNPAEAAWRALVTGKPKEK